MNRQDMLRLTQACLALIIDMEDEMKSSDCTEYRRDHVLPQSVAMWRRIKEEVDRQIDAQDITNGIK